MTSRRRRFPATLLALVAAVPLAITGFVWAAPASSATASPINHVVVLYLENHSFDSILGFWCNTHNNRCPQGGMPSSVTLADGVKVKPSVEPDIVPIVKHSVSSIEDALANNWDHVWGCRSADNYACIGGYSAAQQPNTVTLANTFAINDDTFSMADSPSWGGHLYAVMAQTDHFTGDNPAPARGVKPGSGWGCDSNKVTTWQPTLGAPKQTIPSCIPDPLLIQYRYGGAFEATPASYAKTIMDSLAAANLGWRIYGAPKPGSPGYQWDTCPSIAECLYTSQQGHNVPSARFVADAQNGHLPNFALVLPGGTTAQASEHNGASMTVGDDWIGQVANAVMTGPEWNSTALFITWDDCGCFYDQVKPGTNPDGTLQGPRVPLIIVSPYAKPGFTDVNHATFAGILAYVENTFGLPTLGANDNGAYDFSNAFNYNQTPLSPAQMVWRKWPADAHHIDMSQLQEAS